MSFKYVSLMHRFYLTSQDYLVRLDEKNFIDATHKGNVARFLNHSCAPNCYMKTVSDPLLLHVRLRDLFDPVALRT